MAKKRKDDFMDQGAVDAFMFAQGVTRANKTGLLNSAEAAAADVGIRFPHLSLRFLFQRTTFPLERTTILFGPSGSNKSSFLYYLYSLFNSVGGKFLHLEAEDKDTPVLRLSLTKYDPKAGWARQCATMDAYQTEINDYLAWYKGILTKEGGPGKRVPLIFGVDSLTAKMTGEATKTVEAAHGITGRRFADEARSLSDWFKYMPGLLQGWPICLAAVAHDKPVPGQAGRPDTHKAPGGFAPRYYATYRVLLTKVKTLPQNAQGWEGNKIRMLMEKNSLGSDQMSIEAEIAWRPVQAKNAKGEPILAQQTVWNFHKATVEMLLRMSDKVGGPRGAAVDDLLGLRKVTAGRYVAPGIGVKNDNPLSPTELGKLIEANTELLAQLEPRLGIHPSRAFDPLVDFDAQLEDAKAHAEDYLPVYEGDDAGPDTDEVVTEAAEEE